MSSFRHVAAATLLSATFVPAALIAQQPEGPPLPEGDGIRVRIVTLDSFPFPNADAVILRQLDELPYDEIIIRRSALSIDVVQMALRQLRVLRAVQGEVPAENALYRVGTGGDRGEPPAAPPPAVMAKDSSNARVIVWLLTESRWEHHHPGLPPGRQTFMTSDRPPPPGSGGRPPHQAEEKSAVIPDPW